MELPVERLVAGGPIVAILEPRIGVTLLLLLLLTRQSIGPVTPLLLPPQCMDVEAGVDGQRSAIAEQVSGDLLLLLLLLLGIYPCQLIPLQEEALHLEVLVLDVPRVTGIG